MHHLEEWLEALHRYTLLAALLGAALILGGALAFVGLSAPLRYVGLPLMFLGVLCIPTRKDGRKDGSDS